MVENHTLECADISEVRIYYTKQLPGTSKLFVDERMFIHYILFNPRISGWNITKSLMFSQKAMYRTFLTGKILFYIRIF